VTTFFTALQAMQMRSSDDKAARLSVRPSVRLSNDVDCDNTEERSVQIFTP